MPTHRAIRVPLKVSVESALLKGASSDFAEVALGDRRLTRRLVDIVSALKEQPYASFPKALGGGAASEAFYRLVSNDKVDWHTIFEAQTSSTARRVRIQGRALALHDSSLFQLGGATLREGCFRSAKNKSGFLGPTCLAVSADGRLNAPPAGA